MNPFLDKVPEWIGKRAGMLARGGVGLLLAALIIRGELFREAFRYSLQGLALAMIFTFILYAPGSRVVRWLEHPLMRLLGRRSYAMYLIHYCVLLAMEEKLRLPRLGTAVVAAIITFGYATAMWHLVESPMAKLKKSLSGSKRAKIAHPVMELGSGAPAVSDRI
jgi:peptidoglycan/LPS O-acetylase OafA/YrhL